MQVPLTEFKCRVCSCPVWVRYQNKKYTPRCKPCRKADEERERLARWASVSPTPCVGCSAPVQVKSKMEYDHVLSRGAVLSCSKECSRRAKAAQLRARWDTKTEAEKAAFAVASSARMTAANPMAHTDIRVKAVATRRKNGTHRPSIRGGNGHALTMPQKTLAEMLDGVETEFVVKTNPSKALRTSEPLYVPFHYRVDVAIPGLLLAIEVDGKSHNSDTRRAQDERKDQWLAGNGWTVLRFKNKEIQTNPEKVLACVQSTISKLKVPTRT